MTFNTNEVITLALLILGAGRMVGWYQEKSELRDWKEWRSQVDARFAKHEIHSERRFDEASERMSKLAGIINVLPTQIEDRVEERYFSRDVAAEKFQAIERRLTALEQRQRFPRGQAS